MLEPRTGTTIFGLEYEYYSTDARFGATGQLEPSPNSRRAGHTATFSLQYGLSPFLTLAFRLPVLYPMIENPQYSTQNDPSLHNDSPWMGDVEASFTRALTRRLRSPLFGMSFEALLRLPTGLQSAGDLGEVLLTGTGVTELELALRYARVLTPGFRLELGLRGTRPFSAVVGYLESASGQGDARFAPGMRGAASLRALLQLLPVLGISLGSTLTAHTAYAYGRTTSGFFPTEGLTPLTGSEGLFAEAAGGLILRPMTQGPLLDLYASWRFLGREQDALAALGLTRFSPPPGLTLGGAVRKDF